MLWFSIAICKKSKLDYALAKNEIPYNKEVDNPEVAYLANSFYEAYEELRSYDSSMFYDLIDEPDVWQLPLRLL